MTIKIDSLFQGAPRFHGPGRLGVRPGHPCFARLAISGERPLKVEFEGLPEGLRFDPQTRCLEGRLDRPCEHTFRVKATNAAGAAERDYRLSVGEQLSFAPPIGWNSWNCFGLELSADKVRANAEAIAHSGLADLGWSYVNLDGGWEGDTRTPDGAILPDLDRFPDMGGLVAEIHALGLKAGIYSSPWTRTFGGQPGCSAGPPRAHVRDEPKGWFVGEHSFETANARQWADWGFDFLKYDWNPMDLASGRRMAAALRHCGRDIFFNAVNSMRDEDPRAWATLADAFFLWRRREAGDRDLEDTWASIDSIGFRMSPWRAIASCGHWNDPDMLALGPVGWGTLRPNRLNADEQRTHLSLWALLAGPLLMGGDLSTADRSTFELLANADLLDLHQDPLGRAAARVHQEEGCEVWAKELADGGLAFGFFNRDERPLEYTFEFARHELPRECEVRDIWSGMILGRQRGIDVEIPTHGCEIVRIRGDRPIESEWIDTRVRETLENGARHDRF